MKFSALVLLLLPVCLMGGALNYTIDLQPLAYNSQENGFTDAPSEGYVYTTAPGSYKLPVRTVFIILPHNAENVTATYTVSGLQTISAKTPELNNPYSDGTVMLTSRPALQPAEHVIYQGTGRWGDVVFARFAILPALYDKHSEAYNWIERVNLSISFSETGRQPTRPLSVPKLLRQDDSFVNKETLPILYPEIPYRNYDYLVITTPALYTAAQPLVSFRQSQGLVTSFADINQILATSAGATPPAKVRNYLIAEYLANPFTYLLLIGDIDIVPIAYLTPEPNGVDTVPSDFYYSDLSSDFDHDNDGRLGEFNSGMDYTPELLVGRIPWNTPNTVAPICQRIINFDTSTQPWKSRALLPAAILNYPNEAYPLVWAMTDGATFMEYCKSTVLRNYQCTTLYEQSGLIPSLPSTQILNIDNVNNLIRNQSWGLVNWSAHGSQTTTARKVWMNDLDNDNHPDPSEIQWFGMINQDTFNNLNNQDGSVYFSASCFNGMIDFQHPSLGENLIKKKSVAAIAATRTGWYKIGWQHPGYGGLSSYNYHFLENYAAHGMSVGQAHGFANWLHTQYCLFGDPVDAGGIIWPELQNVYTYLLYGDPAVGYSANTSPPAASILIWEPVGNTGVNIVNGLLDLGPYNVVYTDHLIDTYNYLNQFDAVICLFGFGSGTDAYQLNPASFEYSYLLSYLQQGGKVYLEGMVNWNSADPLFGRFGTIAPFDHLAFIERIRHTDGDIVQIWDYNGYNEGVQALGTFGGTSLPLFHSYNQQHVADIIGIWNRIGESRTISSSFNLGGVYSSVYPYPQFLRIVLDTLGVHPNMPVVNNDVVAVSPPLEVSVSPNPFRDAVSISAKSVKPVNLSIYNIKGQLVKSVRLKTVNGKAAWQWAAGAEAGTAAASGIYLIRADNGQNSAMVKTVKLR